MRAKAPLAQQVFGDCGENSGADTYVRTSRNGAIRRKNFQLTSRMPLSLRERGQWHD